MLRWVVALGLVAGCDIAFGISPVGPCDPAFDEDLDGICDDTDPCPIDSGDDADMDRDRIGDSCDPHPTDPVDMVQLFDPFTEPDASWADIGASPWMQGPTSFDHPDANANGQLQRTVAANIQPTVEVQIDAMLDSELGSVGIYVQNKTNVPLECRVVHVGGANELRMLLGQVDENVSVLNILKRTGPLQGSGRLRIIGGQLDDGSVRCSANFAGYPSLHVEALQGAIDPMDDFNVLGFHTIGAAASYQSLMIYTL